jgi:hypothetical protein
MPLPATFRARLRAMRARLTAWLLVAGISPIGLAALGLVVADAVIDRTFRMDYSQRLIMLCLIVAIIVGLVVWRLIIPLSRRASDDALVLELEAHDRGLRDQLISAVQLAREPPSHSGVSSDLVQATIDRGLAIAEGLDVRAAFDRRAWRRNLLLTLVAALGLGAVAWGIANTAFGATWFRRNILLSADEWPRDTRLIVIGAADNRIVIARGEDHAQSVIVDPDSRVTDVEVWLVIDDERGQRMQRMERSGRLDGREHQLVFRAVAQPFRFQAQGGDDKTEWIRVEVVEPPTALDVELTMLPPAYAGVASQPLPPGGGPHRILEGSGLEVRAATSKPLASAELVHGAQRWPLAMNDDRLACTLPADELASGKYTFELVDQLGLRSSRPTSFLLTLEADQPPQPRAALVGIGGLVTPRARIPMTLSITDELAVTSVEIVHEWRAGNNDNQVSSGVLAVAEAQPMLGGPQVDVETVVDLEPLAVPVGVSLRLVVRATDNNTLSGPGIGQSRDFLLRVVSEGELRAELLRREIEGRRAFETIIKQQEELVVELTGIGESYPATGAAPSETAEGLAQRLVELARKQKSVGTSVAAVADRFDGILAEARNNRLDEPIAGAAPGADAVAQTSPTANITQRLEMQIVLPLRELDEAAISGVGRHIDATSRGLGQAESFRESSAATLEQMNEVLAAMRRILAAMQDAETFQEIVNKTIEVKRNQEQVRALTHQRQEQSRAEDIFDDDPFPAEQTPPPPPRGSGPPK